MNLRQLALLGVLCSVAGTGCATVTGNCIVKRGYDLSKMKKVAVVEVTFGNRGHIDEYSAAANQIADLISDQFFRKGYSTVERAQIVAVLKEIDFGHSGMTSDEDAARIGKILNVSAVVIGNVQECGEKFVITVKAVDTETAEHLIKGDGKGEAHSKVTKIVSLAGGAAVGAGVGGAVGGKKGAVLGGLGGAFGGLIAGEMLSEDVYDIAKKTIEKVFENLPEMPST